MNADTPASRASGPPSAHPSRAAAVPAVRTYLTMDSPVALCPSAVPALRLDVAEHRHCTAAEYRRLYREVGAAWQWHDRERWTDARLAEHLAAEAVHVWIARIGHRIAGFFELLEDPEGAVEIAYFGLTPPFIGQGLGGALLTRAVEEAWRLGARRVWLHTCTLDSPHALPNYLARGFRVEREERYEASLR